MSRFIRWLSLSAVLLGCAEPGPTPNDLGDSSADVSLDASDASRRTSHDAAKPVEADAFVSVDAADASETPDAADDRPAVDEPSAADVVDSTEASAVDSGVAVQPDSGTVARALSVVGNQLVSGGKTVRLIGVNYPGTEYMCMGGASNGIFQGPNDQSLIQAFKGQLGQSAWKINVVRVPLNEDCWLGINRVPSVQGGAAYQSAVRNFVTLLRTSGLFVILDLHWNAPGAYLADGQQPMADADHAPDFWKSVASVFKADTGVLFDLYNEPSVYPPSGTVTGDYPADQSWWACWQTGNCSVTASNGETGGQPNPSCPLYPSPLPPASTSWKVAGMQSLVDAVRGTGATNVLMLGGLGVANILDHWLDYEPTDSLNPPQLAASLHQYDVAVGTTAAYWDSTVAPVAAKVPVITGEFGEADNGTSFVSGFMTWADAHGLSYVAWAFNPYGSPALVTDFTGAATSFGSGFRSHIASLPTVPAPAPL